MWAGKAEHTSFDAPTVSLHAHERIESKTVMDARAPEERYQRPAQRDLFESPAQQRSLRDALDFYRHSHAWSNWLITGDSLLARNPLLEKESMAGNQPLLSCHFPVRIEIQVLTDSR